MKRQVRSGMFETNSSSVHALIIPRECNVPQRKLYVSHGEFGWEVKKYRSPDDLISYLCQGVCGDAWLTARYELGIKDDAKIREYVERSVMSFVAPIKEHGLDIEFDDGYFGLDGDRVSGYIDHCESLDLDAFANDADKLLRFVFGGEIITGNDNTKGMNEFLNYGFDPRDSEVVWKGN